jgi:hypothetical protein
MASGKFHITDSGDVRPCNATKRPCRYGDSDHYTDRTAARNAAEERMASETGLAIAAPISKATVRAKAADASAVGTLDPDRYIAADELEKIKSRLRTEKYSPKAGFYSEWRSTGAQAAVLRTELDSRGINSAGIKADELAYKQYLVLNEDGTRIVKATDSRAEAEAKSWRGQPALIRNDVLAAGSQKLERSEPGNSLAVGMMEEHLQLEEAGHYPVQPQRLNRYSSEQLDTEAREFEYDHRYDVGEILHARGVDEEEIDEAEQDYGGYVTVKIPSGSEATISVELARREIAKGPAAFGIAPRRW